MSRVRVTCRVSRVACRVSRVACHAPDLDYPPPPSPFPLISSPSPPLPSHALPLSSYVYHDIHLSSRGGGIFELGQTPTGLFNFVCEVPKHTSHRLKVREGSFKRKWAVKDPFLYGFEAMPVITCNYM